MEEEKNSEIVEVGAFVFVDERKLSLLSQTAL